MSYTDTCATKRNSIKSQLSCSGKVSPVHHIDRFLCRNDNGNSIRIDRNSIEKTVKEIQQISINKQRPLKVRNNLYKKTRIDNVSIKLVQCHTNCTLNSSILARRMKTIEGTLLLRPCKASMPSMPREEAGVDGRY